MDDLSKNRLGWKLASANDRSWISAKYLEAASRCWWPDGRWEVPTIFWSRTRHNRQAKTRKAAYCKLLVLGWCFRWQVYLSIEACRAVKLSKLLPGSVRGFRPWCWRLSSSFPSGWPDVMCIRYHSVKFKKKTGKKRLQTIHKAFLAWDKSFNKDGKAPLCRITFHVRRRGFRSLNSSKNICHQQHIFDLNFLSVLFFIVWMLHPIASNPTRQRSSKVNWTSQSESMEKHNHYEISWKTMITIN